MADRAFKTRNPWLVIPWAVGLLVLLALPQALYAGLEAGMPSLAEVGMRKAALALGLALLTLAVGIPVTALVLRYLWRRPLDWVGLSPGPGPGRLLSGLLWGILAPLPPLAVLAAAGVATVAPGPALAAPLAAAPVLASYLLFWLYAAAAEEIVFRGMIAREIAARHGWMPAWLIGGAVFGLLHFQPAFGAVGALWLLAGGVLVSGLFLALYLRARSLWLPIGFHLGWNFCLTNLVGAPMSGRDLEAGLLSTSLEGPSLLTGGEFGMEVSLVTLAAYVLYALAALRLPRRDGRALLPAAPPESAGGPAIRPADPRPPGA